MEINLPTQHRNFQNIIIYAKGSQVVSHFQYERRRMKQEVRAEATKVEP